MNNNNMTLGFDLDALMNKGKPRFEKRKYESLKEGTQSFKILPSFNPANLRLDHKYYVHWLKFTNERGEQQNIKVLSTKYTEGYCPLFEAHKQADEALKHAKANGATGEHLKRLEEAEYALRASGTVYYNAVNTNGEVVILQLSSTVSGLLDKKIIEAVKDLQIDPTDVRGGVWFTFNKQGKGRESVTVDFKQNRSNVNGKIVSELDQTALSEELIAKLPTAVADIHNPEAVGIRVYTAKELADFLRGIPLPDKRKNQAQASTDAAPAQSQSAPTSTQNFGGAPAQGETIVDAIARTDASGSTLGAALNADAGKASSAPVATDAAAEIARLRAMSNKK